MNYKNLFLYKSVANLPYALSNRYTTKNTDYIYLDTESRVCSPKLTLTYKHYSTKDVGSLKSLARYH